jgi:hypothetical protein
MLKTYNIYIVRRKPMTRVQAIDKLHVIMDTDDWGGLTTGMCEALGVRFENFLRFAKLDETGKKLVIRALWRNNHSD